MQSIIQPWRDIFTTRIAPARWTWKLLQTTITSLKTPTRRYWPLYPNSRSLQSGSYHGWSMFRSQWCIDVFGNCCTFTCNIFIGSQLSDIRPESREAWLVARAISNSPNARRQIMSRHRHVGRVVVLFSHRSRAYLAWPGRKSARKRMTRDSFSQIHVDHRMESIRIPCHRRAFKGAEI
jgi:hypothetical protein